MLSALLLAALALAQDPAPQPSPPPLPQGNEEAPQTATAAALALVPGALPESTTTTARELWNALVSAARANASDVAPPSGIDLTFDMRIYKDRGSNDVDSTRFRFDPRGWLRTSIQKSGRERLHGPQGSYLVDEGRATLLEGREHEQDKKEILETLAICRNFLALADPRALRIAKLEVAPAPPSELAPELAEKAKALQWLAIESPDFHLVQSGKVRKHALYRVRVGLDPRTHLPALVTIEELATVPQAQPSAPQLVVLARYETLDGFQVPKELATYASEPRALGYAFRDRPSASLFVLPGGTLRPTYTEQDFLPPAK